MANYLSLRIHDETYIALKRQCTPEAMRKRVWDAVHDSFEESKHPRNASGQFGKGGASTVVHVKHTKPLTDDEFVEKSAANAKLDERQSKGLRRYAKDETAENVNRKLRTDAPLNEEERTLADAVDSAINSSRLQDDRTLYRGLGGKTSRQRLENLSAGDILQDKSYMSTSLSRAAAEKFGNVNRSENSQPQMMIVRAKKGQNVALMGNHVRSYNVEEQEGILPRGAKLKYAGKSEEGHHVFDYVD